MTGELIPQFEGKEIRAIEKDGDLWFPLVDIAKAWCISRATLPDIIARNEELFRGYYALVSVTLTTPENGLLSCVNEQGLYLIMGRITSSRLKDPYAQETILRFQRFVPELLKAYRKKEIVQVPAAPDIKQELQKAGEYAEICKCDAHTLQAAVFKKHNLPELADALQVPAMQHGETGWYNPTRLIALCNDPDLTPERLNWYLHNKGFQVREGFIWRLTDAGKIHGMEYPYEAPSGHRETRIRWRESILYASGLKRPVDEHQLALSARA